MEGEQNGPAGFNRCILVNAYIDTDSFVDVFHHLPSLDGEVLRRPADVCAAARENFRVR